MTADVVAEGPVVLGPYRLDGLIGRGGMGEVHRAFDTRRGRVVALKLLPPHTAHDESFRARFRREADSAARLQDPHIVPIHDFGEIEGRLFIDMRLVDGVGLDQLIAAGPMDPRRAVALVSQAAEALSDAHGSGVLHRDVKPSNMIVTRSDFLYLADFGISRAINDEVTALTHSGATIGTLAYMAPERFDGGPANASADVYSLACTLAECLTGRRPFDATSLPSLMKAHLLAEPPRPSLERRDVPQAMDEVIARGMAKNPVARYATARDLAAAATCAIGQWGPHAAASLAPATVVPAPMTAMSSPTRPTRAARSRFLPLAMGGVLIALASGAGGYMLGYSSDRGEAPAAQASTLTSEVPSAAPQAASDLPPPTAAPAENIGDVATYVYTVESNYEVFLSYTDSQGDQVQLSSVSTPWTVSIDTSEWGADATPSLQVSSSSSKGDTTVSCTIADQNGRVVASDDRSSAYAAAICFVFN